MSIHDALACILRLLTQFGSACEDVRVHGDILRVLQTLPRGGGGGGVLRVLNGCDNLNKCGFWIWGYGRGMAVFWEGEKGGNGEGRGHLEYSAIR